MKKLKNAGKSGVSVKILANGKTPNVKTRAIPCRAVKFFCGRCNDYSGRK